MGSEVKPSASVGVPPGVTAPLPRPMPQGQYPREYYEPDQPDATGPMPAFPQPQGPLPTPAPMMPMAALPTPVPAGGLACPGCGEALVAGSRFCGECGYRLETRIIACHLCGAPQESDAKFCGECGSRMHDNKPAPAAPANNQALGAYEDYLTRQKPSQAGWVTKLKKILD